MAKILFVEDDIGYQELGTIILAKQYELTVCATAEDAVTKLDQESFDLIVSDINMFGMTGFELLNKVRREGKLCPVILCTAQTDQETKDAAMAAGAAGFVEKPYTSDILLPVVKSWLRPKRL